MSSPGSPIKNLNPGAAVVANNTRFPNIGTSGVQNAVLSVTPVSSASFGIMPQSNSAGNIAATPAVNTPVNNPAVNDPVNNPVNSPAANAPANAPANAQSNSPANTPSNASNNEYGGENAVEEGEPKPHKQTGPFSHFSDVDTWGHPDRNYYIFVALTIFAGFVGFDHFYLRSYNTAFQKILVNIFGLGFWYFWDLIQILKEGKKVQTEGLTSPLDWTFGIGRGVFVPLESPANDKNKKAPKFAAEKSYLLYTILAVCLGFVGADKFYLGKTWQGVGKMLSVFNIFLFLFGILWVVWDAVYALFFTDKILEKGIPVPLPFNFLTGKPVPGSVFLVQEVKPKPPQTPKGFWESIPFLGSFMKSLHVVPDYAKTAMETVVTPLVGPTACGVVANAKKAVSIGTKIMPLVTTGLTAGPALISDIGQQVSQITADPTKLLEGAPRVPGLSSPTEELGTSMQAIQSLANSTAAQRQTGGGLLSGSSQPLSSESTGAGPVLAGAITALLIAGGLKGAHDFLSSR